MSESQKKNSQEAPAPAAKEKKARKKPVPRERKSHHAPKDANFQQLVVEAMHTLNDKAGSSVMAIWK